MTDPQRLIVTHQVKQELGGLLGCSGCLELLALNVGIAACLAGGMFGWSDVGRFGVACLGFWSLSIVATWVLVGLAFRRAKSRIEVEYE